MNKMTEQKYCNVLVCDGGGVRGILTTQFLKNLEMDIGTSLNEYFDIFCGTSTGAIICAALACGFSANDLYEKFYTFDNAKRIFKQKTWLGWSGISPKYSDKPKYDLAREIFGDIKLKQIQKGFIAPVFNITTRKPYFWSNLNYEPFNPLLIDVLNATTAAPVYFPCSQVPFKEDVNKERCIQSFAEGPLSKNAFDLAIPDKDDWYIDGGVAANSPSTIAYCYARHYFIDTTIKIFSIGTGRNTSKINGDIAKKWGAVQWMSKGGLIDIMLNTSNIVNNYETSSLLEKNFIRINTELPSYIDSAMDNTTNENLNNLRKIGKELYEENKEQIMEFLK